MTFWQQFAIAILTLLLVPLVLKWADIRFKAAADKAGPPRKSYRQLTDENIVMHEALRQIWVAFEDYEKFCANGQNEAAAATIASMKRDIKPEWRS